MTDLRAILFDVNGTLIDIETNERRHKIYRVISRFLTYQGVVLSPEEIHDRYFAALAAQRAGSRERYPEYDVVAIWRELLQAAGLALATLPAEKLGQLPVFLAELHRALARKRLALYPDVRTVLDTLRRHYALGVVSDAQSAYAVPELRAAGLGDCFATIIVSGDYGYRKPDPRLFAAALAALGLRPDQAIYAGNDMYCDIFGAQQAGLRTIFRPTQFGRKAYGDVTPDVVIDRFADLPAAVALLAARSPRGASAARPAQQEDI
jgi:putative hydrolase of the HAD superfamily